MQIRTALFGREVSKIKEGKDEYKIQVRNQELQRKSLTDLLNMKITFRDFNTGQIKQVPISSVIKKVDYTSTYGSIKRKNQKRVITLYSNVLSGYTPTAVNQDLGKAIANFTHKPTTVSITKLAKDNSNKKQVLF